MADLKEYLAKNSERASGNRLRIKRFVLDNYSMPSNEVDIFLDALDPNDLVSFSTNVYGIERPQQVYIIVYKEKTLKKYCQTHSVVVPQTIQGYNCPKAGTLVNGKNESCKIT